MRMFYWIYLYLSVGYTPKNEVGESQVSVCSVSVDNTKQFSRLFLLFYTPISSAEKLQLFHVLPKVGYYLFLI